MILWPSLVVEIVAIATFFVVFGEAVERGTRSLFTLLAATLFGLAVEAYFVTQFSGYEYGQFLFALPVGGGEVIPVWIALGWGTIIWTSMLAGDRTGLPWYIRPAFDALCALSLDLTLDPMAEQLGWWHWQRPAQFFGIPCDNFIGWLIIVAAYSAASRLAFHVWPSGKIRWRDALLAMAALVPAVLGVVLTQMGLPYVYAALGEPKTLLALLALLTAPVAWTLGTARAAAVPGWPLEVIPIVYHGLMLLLLLVAGGPEELLLVFPVAAALSLVMFTFPRVARAPTCSTTR